MPWKEQGRLGLTGWDLLGSTSTSPILRLLSWIRMVGGDKLVHSQQVICTLTLTLRIAMGHGEQNTWACWPRLCRHCWIFLDHYEETNLDGHGGLGSKNAASVSLERIDSYNSFLELVWTFDLVVVYIYIYIRKFWWSILNQACNIWVEKCHVMWCVMC